WALWTGGRSKHRRNPGYGGGGDGPPPPLLRRKARRQPLRLREDPLLHLLLGGGLWVRREFFVGDEPGGERHLGAQAPAHIWTDTVITGRPPLCVCASTPSAVVVSPWPARSPSHQEWWHS